MILIPATYAHHRFGQLAFPQLPEHAKRTIQHFRRLYNVGQHGPDFFFYFQPFYHTATGQLGKRYHAVTGKEFFETAAASLRQVPSEGAEAYLYGVLGHFALDSVCHPMVCAIAKEGSIGHTELETEFDRYLLTLDGKEPAHLQDLGKPIRGLTWGECVTISEFYPPATAYTVRRCFKTMTFVNRALAMKNRELLERVFRLGGKTGADLVMYSRPNRKCAHLLQPMQDRFTQAMARYPSMVSQLTACIQENVPLGEDFLVPFG